eukprot:9147592-Pyramimonas_sp.AAC.1
MHEFILGLIGGRNGLGSIRTGGSVGDVMTQGELLPLHGHEEGSGRAAARKTIGRQRQTKGV